MKILELALSITRIAEKIISKLEEKRKREKEDEINNDPQSVFKREFMRDDKDSETSVPASNETNTRED